MTTIASDAFERSGPLGPNNIGTADSTVEMVDVSVPVSVVTDTFERAGPLGPNNIGTADSTIDMVGAPGSHVAVWDDPTVNWDSPFYAWGGRSLVEPETGAAFAGLAFQSDAFPTSAVITVAADQALPALTQAFVAHTSSGIVQIDQTLPALTQEVIGSPVAVDEACSELPAIAETSETTLTVTAFVGNPAAPWQADTFQPDAFRTGAGHGQLLPAFTQHAVAVKLGVGEASAESHLPSLEQVAIVGVSVTAITVSTLPAFTQEAESFSNPQGQMTSTLPAFTQHFVAASFIQPDVSGIQQTLPALTQSFRVTLAIWDEWDVTSGDEWRVREHV